VRYQYSSLLSAGVLVNLNLNLNLNLKRESSGMAAAVVLSTRTFGDSSSVCGTTLGGLGFDRRWASFRGGTRACPIFLK
jgi:hypothetical protein